MITLHADVVTALATKPTNYFYLLKITNELGVVTKAITTHPATISISGTNYVSSGSIIRLDPPQMTTSVDREQYKIVLSDPDFTEGAEADANMTGFDVEVRMGFLNASTKLPMLTLAQTILMYAGIIDGVSYLIKTEVQGEVLFQITCSSPLADLDLKRAMYCSKDYMRGRYPTDSSCDQVYGGSGVLQLKWGKS